jgi:hypothetical protein
MGSQTDPSNFFTGKWLHNFKWTTTQVYQLKQMLAACITNPGVTAAIGASAIYGTSYWLDLVFGPRTHTASFSANIFNWTFIGLQASLTADLKNTMTSAMKEVPKLIFLVVSTIWTFFWAINLKIFKNQTKILAYFLSKAKNNNFSSFSFAEFEKKVWWKIKLDNQLQMTTDD